MYSISQKATTPLTFFVIGVNHQTAPIQIRELFAFNPKETVDFLRDAKRRKIITHGMLLSTCNRMQLFVVSDLPEGLFRKHLVRLIVEYKRLPITYSKYFFCKEGTNAMHELFYLLSGYRSMVQGETQIVSQVKEALTLAKSVNMVSTTLLKLFEKGLEIAKKIRSKYSIYTVNKSAGSAAVTMLAQRPGFANAQHLIIGAGQIGATVAQALHGEGVEQIALYNRTQERAEKFAAHNEIETIYSELQLSEALGEADYLWVATSASSPVIIPVHLKILRDRCTLFDLGLPRNVAPEVANSKEYYCIDDLQITGIDLLSVAIPTEVVAQVDEAIVEFVHWKDLYQSRDLYSIIREDTETILLRELQKLLPKLAISDEEKAGLEARVDTELSSKKLSSKLSGAVASSLIARIKRLTEEDEHITETARKIYTN